MHALLTDNGVSSFTTIIIYHIKVKLYRACIYNVCISDPFSPGSAHLPSK